MASSRRPADEGGQMMLLAAVVLLIAFMSLSVMVSRISSIATETSRDEGAFLREARVVANVLNAGEVNTAAEFNQLAAFSAERGFSLTCTSLGMMAGGDEARLSDGFSVFTVQPGLTTLC